jgi:dTDP-6-deoxy-L-talose 4-dehydrogenase (NAD+)
MNSYEYFGRPDALIHLVWKDGFMYSLDAHIDDLPAIWGTIVKYAE